MVRKKKQYKVITTRMPDGRHRVQVRRGKKGTGRVVVTRFVSAKYTSAGKTELRLKKKYGIYQK